MNTFIKKIVQNREVFIVEDSEGIGMAQSLLFQDDEGVPVGVICFWSEELDAKKCCAEDWKSYHTQSICLATFIEDYLVPIYNESLIVGLNFDEKVQGLEADPLNLLEILILELKKQNCSLEFEYFKDLNDLEKQINQLLTIE